MPVRKSQLNNQISSSTNIMFHILVGFFVLLCLLPLVLVLSISFSSEDSIKINGYRFIPEEWGVQAYQHLLETGDQILRSYMISILMTAVGTTLAVFFILLCAYAVSRKEFRYRKMVTIYLLIPMLFNAGLVPFYLIATRVLHLQNTFWALVLPTLVNPFYILIMKSFLQFNVPEAIVESGRIEGANEWQILFRLIMPIAMPAIATITFFNVVAYWNNWFNALLFISEARLIPLPNLLLQIERSIDFLVRNSSRLGSAETFAVLKRLPVQTIIFATVAITTGPIVIAYPFFQRYFVRGLTVGSLKA